MTGEHKPDTGSQVWRHPNLRLAYVAQHAFHHLEEHLDTTPLKYMFHRWVWACGRGCARDLGWLKDGGLVGCIGFVWFWWDRPSCFAIS